MTGSLTRFLALDLRVLHRQLRSFAMMVVITAALAYSLGQFGAIPMMVMYSTMTLGAPFAAGDRFSYDVLLGSLPLRRRTVVTGRYVEALLVATAAGLVGVVIDQVVNLLKQRPPMVAVSLATLAASLAVFAVIAAIQLPVLFRYGYARALWVVMVPALVLVTAFLGAQWAGARLTVPTWVVQPSVLVGAALVVAGLALAVSHSVSLRIYNARQL